MSEFQPVYEPQPVYTYPMPVQNKPNLALKIVSMALSIAGFTFMCIGLLYTLLGLIEEGLAFGMAFSFSLFFLPLCIVGFALSLKCINAGDTSKFSQIGKILGLIGIILSGVSLFIGIISLAVV